ncbi:MAG: MATE family efflux transporter [Thermoguttaceae bacterium]
MSVLTHRLDKNNKTQERIQHFLPMDLLQNWWNRPCGGKEVCKQAIPLVISTGSLSLMTFTDRMFLVWSGPDGAVAMSASMQGGMLLWTSVAIPLAVAMFCTTFVAQYQGSGNANRIGPVVWQGIWIGLAAMPLLLLIAPLLNQLFVLFGHSEELLRMEQHYFWLLLWGSGGTIASEAAAAFFRGRAKMSVEMNVNLVCVFLNVILDYCWIFGKFGFPEWGLSGAALATVCSQWFRLVFYLFLIFWSDASEKRFGVLAGMKLDWSLLGRLLYFGVPSSSYSLMDTMTFTLFLMIVGGLGDQEMNASTLAFTMNMFSFLPLVGIGIVVTSMVGNQLGDERPDLARRATNTAFVLGSIYTGLFGLLYLVIPNLMLAGFAAFADPEEFASMADLTIILLRFIALYLFFDNCSIILSSALRGAGDTIYVMRIVFFLAPLLPTLCVVGIYFFGFGLLWCWSILTAYVFAYSVFFTHRYLGNIWEKMRVIERELQKPHETKPRETKPHDE